LPKVVNIGDNFLYNNNVLTNLEIPLIEVIGSDFLYHNTALENLQLPSDAYFYRDGFLENNKDLANKLLCK